VIRVVVGDLAAVSADAIVRPVTTRLAAITPPGERLDRAGGPAFQRAIELRTELAVGAAVVTPGGGLPAEFVIHAVVRADPAPVTAKDLTRAWRSVLERAKEWQFGHLAVPPLFAGSPELRLADVAEAMAAVLRAHGETGDFPTAVSFVVESDDERAVFTAAMRLGEAFRQ
jgi:O-acetyl-ADP-ribose deacetylase (regulator of RNase III)